jgi:hypothetical protein
MVSRFPITSRAQNRVTTVVDGGKSIEEFVKAFQKVKDQLTSVPTDGVPGLPTDEAKILADANAIDEELEKYANLAEASQYRAALRAASL